MNLPPVSLIGNKSDKFLRVKMYFNKIYITFIYFLSKYSDEFIYFASFLNADWLKIVYSIS